MVLVIIAGHIDLSVGSVAAFVGIVVAIAMRDWGIPGRWASSSAWPSARSIGAWQGFWTAYVGIPAFIVTLAGMLLFRGANQFVGKSNTDPRCRGLPADRRGLPARGGPNTGYNNLTLLLGLLACAVVVSGAASQPPRARKIGADRRGPGSRSPGWSHLRRRSCAPRCSSPPAAGAFPIPGLILVALVLLYGFIATKTVVGRHIYAVGGNRHAAELSGVRSKRVNFLVMMNMSVLAALAGMIFVARSTASGPFDGVGWELDAIAAVFIGGAAVTGGVGTVIGSIVGGLVMAVLNNGLQLMGVGADATQMIKGLVLLAAVAFDVYNKSQGRPSIIGLLMRNRGSKSADAAEEPSAATEIEKLDKTIGQRS